MKQITALLLLLVLLICLSSCSTTSYQEELFYQNDPEKLRELRQASVDRHVEGMVPLELNTRYLYGQDLYISFTGIRVSEDKARLTLEAEFTNTGTSEATPATLNKAYFVHYIRPDSPKTFQAVMIWYSPEEASTQTPAYRELVVAPGSTAAGYLILNNVNNIPKILELYEGFYGYLWLDLDGATYCLDLGPYIS